MVQTNGVNSMNDEAFPDLREAMEDAVAYERGERRNLKVSRIQAPRPAKASAGQSNNSSRTSSQETNSTVPA